MRIEYWDSIGRPCLRDGKIVGECRIPECQANFDVAICKQRLEEAEERGEMPSVLKGLRKQLRLAEERLRDPIAEKALEEEKMLSAAIDEAGAERRFGSFKDQESFDFRERVSRGAILRLGVPVAKIRFFYEFYNGMHGSVQYIKDRLWVRDESVGEILSVRMPRCHARFFMALYRMETCYYKKYGQPQFSHAVFGLR